MNLIKVHPLVVRHHEYEVHVSTSGDFQTTVGATTLTSPTYSGLKDKLLDLTAKAAVTVHVPFVLMTGGGMVNREPARGVVTGIHGGNGNLMVSWSTGWQAGQKTQWTPNYGDVIFTDATAEEVEQWRALRKASSDAQNALNQFEHDRKIQLKELAVKAVAEAVNDAGQA